MIFWGLIILGCLSWMGSAHTIAAHGAEPRGLLRRNHMEAKPTRLLNGQPNRGENTNQPPECIVNPYAAIAAHSKGDEVKHSTIYRKHHHLVDEQEELQVHDVLTKHRTPLHGENKPREREGNSFHHEEEKITTEKPKETSTHHEKEKITTEKPKETSTHHEEKTTTVVPEETTTDAEGEMATTVIPEETTTLVEEEKTTTELAVETTTLTEEHKEPADQPDEKSTIKTPVEEPKIVHKEIDGPTKHDCKNDTATLPKRKSKAPRRRPINDEADDDEDEDSSPRQGGRRGGSVYKNFFPVTFTGAGRNRPRDAVDGAGDAGMGAVIAIANSFSKGRGAVASSSAVANGSPELSQYRQSRRNSRYRVRMEPTSY